MSGSASWCFIAKALRRANDELERRKVRSLEYYGGDGSTQQRGVLVGLLSGHGCGVDGWKGEEEQSCAVLILGG